MTLLLLILYQKMRFIATIFLLLTEI